MAAFTLGRLKLEELGKPSEAARAFEEARRLAPKGPLAEDALAREVEAWVKAGEADKASAAATEYKKRYPRGVRLEWVRSLTR